MKEPVKEIDPLFRIIYELLKQRLIGKNFILRKKKNYVREV